MKKRKWLKPTIRTKTRIRQEKPHTYPPQGTSEVPKIGHNEVQWDVSTVATLWNKFTAEIEATNLGAVTKFAYLKKLLEPKVRVDIDGLLFTTEGYELAKNILLGEPQRSYMPISRTSCHYL